jgi:hypothetical protein
MICPECKAEYRPGFTRCSDCDVELVYELARDAAPEVEQNGGLRSVWQGDDQQECVSLCLALKNAGISYSVSQSMGSRNSRMQVDWKYELAVPNADYEGAKKILGFEAEPAEGEGKPGDLEDETVWELPDADISADDERGKSDSYLRNWYPEDATTEVWSQSPSNESSTVELSLKENLIRFRVDRLEDGTCKVFVMPEDEMRAREIVREIVEGAPPG